MRANLIAPLDACKGRPIPARNPRTSQAEAIRASGHGQSAGAVVSVEPLRQVKRSAPWLTGARFAAEIPREPGRYAQVCSLREARSASLRSRLEATPSLTSLRSVIA